MPVASHPFPGRLAALRRRWRFVALTRGTAALLAAFLLAVALVGLLDWLVKLPDVIRAFCLVGILAGSGIILWKLLIEPLAVATDDLSLALRVEEYYPELNDGLASAVQFLETAEERTGLGSATVRRAAVRQALLTAESCDFHRVVPSRGLGMAGAALVFSLMLAATLLVADPLLAQTALLRLADPFGEHPWPAATRLVDLSAPQRMARGEAFVVRGQVEGVIPDDAIIRIQIAGRTSEHVVPLHKQANGEHASLQARVERDRVSKNFRYQVQANDAISRWQEVVVLPPPQLAPLAGRASPQTELRYPAYTELPPQHLADGSRLISAVAGTQVRARAGTDRPVARAWMEYEPEYPATRLGSVLTSLAAHSPPTALALTAGGQSVWGPVPARLDASGTVLGLEFVPWISGTYALRLEDDTGIGSRTLFQISVTPDPAPKVLLERPSSSRDSLFLLPDADITLQLVVEDPEFAIRSIFMEYRCRKEDPPRRLPIFHHASLSNALTAISATLARTPMPPLRLRPPRLAITQRLSLRQFRHADGTALKEGDILTLVACGDDFDNVAVDKKPGRSHEVELRIVGLPTLEAMLHQNQAQIQQELLRLRELERKARNEAAALLKQEQAIGKLGPDDLKRLTELVDQQKQIRERVGNEQEGLRAQVARALQTLRDNHLPKGGAQERLDLVDQELDRLAREELEQIEAALTNARKENEQKEQPKPGTPPEPSALGQATEHQAEVEQTLEDLLAKLDAWSNSRQARAEAKAILQEQHRLTAQTERLPDQVPAGAAPMNLTPEQRAELDKAAEAQRRLGEHASQLLQKMERIAGERGGQAQDKINQAEEKERLVEDKKEEAQKARPADPAKADRLDEEARVLAREAAALREEAAMLREEAKALQEAAQLGRSGQTDDHMRQAADHIGQNQVGNAGKEQRAGAESLEQMVRALEDRREKELDSLIRKLKDAEQELARLVEDQERLRKKMQDAQGIADPQKRDAELKRLAREQEQLRKRAGDLTRQLSRSRADRARDALGRANERMGEAGEQLDRNQDAGQEQDDALDRLDEALEEIQEARRELEEELAREKLAKIADQIKQLKERQASLLAESGRIQRRVLENQSWDRSQRTNLLALARGQAGLKEETANLADGKLAPAKVFARILKMSADAMDQAAQSMQERDKNLADLDVAREQAADRRTQELQQRALQRLDQLLDALKEEQGMARRPRQPQQPMPGGENQPAGGESDGIPQLAELKALRALQQEVNQRTEQFGRQHPDADKLTEPQKKELESIRNDQKQVHDLLDELTAPEAAPQPRPKGDK